MGSIFMVTTKFDIPYVGYTYTQEASTPNVITCDFNISYFKSGYVYKIETININSNNIVNNQCPNIGELSKHTEGGQFYPPKSVTLDGKNIHNNRTINFQYNNNNRVLIKGIVKKNDVNLIPSVINIYEVCLFWQKKFIGSYISTDGLYFINFQIKDNCSYILEVVYTN